VLKAQGFHFVPKRRTIGTLSKWENPTPYPTPYPGTYEMRWLPNVRGPADVGSKARLRWAVM
jgi:hypothetical protein